MVETEDAAWFVGPPLALTVDTGRTRTVSHLAPGEVLHKLSTTVGEDGEVVDEVVSKKLNRCCCYKVC